MRFTKHPVMSLHRDIGNLIHLVAAIVVLNGEIQYILLNN